MLRGSVLLWKPCTWPMCSSVCSAVGVGWEDEHSLHTGVGYNWGEHGRHYQYSVSALIPISQFLFLVIGRWSLASPVWAESLQLLKMEAVCWYKGNRRCCCCCRRAFPPHPSAPSGAGSAVAPASQGQRCCCCAGRRGRPAPLLSAWLFLLTAGLYTSFYTCGSSPVTLPSSVQQAVLANWADWWATSSFIDCGQVFRVAFTSVLWWHYKVLVLACLNSEDAWKGGGSGRGGFARVSLEASVKPLLCICLGLNRGCIME